MQVARTAGCQLERLVGRADLHGSRPVVIGYGI